MNNTLENLLKQDSEFSEAKFKSKVENTFVQIKLSMVTGKTEIIHHFVNEETYQKIVQKVENDKSNNRIQLYDELNVADVQILKIEEQEDSFKIEVNVHSKALEYYIARDTRKYISGDRYNRVERMNKIIYTKLKNSQDMGVARKCPSCGANIDVNKNGQCEYCGAIFNLQNYDWVITYMDV